MDMTHDTLISERPSRRPTPINAAARRELDRERFLIRHHARRRRRAVWIDVAPCLREAGITEYPPPDVAHLIVPHGGSRYGITGDDDPEAA